MPTQKDKYYLNEKTRKLHIIGGCCHSKYIHQGAKCFKTEEEAIRSETRHMAYCKNCFKEKQFKGVIKNMGDITHLIL